MTSLNSSCFGCDLLIKNQDELLKSNYSLNDSLIRFDKLVVSIHVQKIEKIYDYFVLQSICLVDTITGQKPKLKVLKCKYTFGSRAFSFSCKSTLRRRKLLMFLSILQFIILSEMKRRHVSVSSLIDHTNRYKFSFSISNTNVFLKLDEFYFKWNYPIVFNFASSQKRSLSLSKSFSIYSLPI